MRIVSITGLHHAVHDDISTSSAREICRVSRLRSAALALAVALTLVAWPTAASATNFSGATGGYGCDVPNMADNRDHFIWYEALQGATATALNWTRVNNYNPTDLNTFREDVRDPTTDVIAHDADYEGRTCGHEWQSGVDAGISQISGIFFCVSLAGSRCQQAEIHFDNDYMGPHTATEENWLACHELGHTLGLQHYGWLYCMKDPGPTAPALSGHDVDHINFNY